MLGDPTMNGASPSEPVRQLLESLERVQSRNGSYIASVPRTTTQNPASASAKARMGWPS
jgi:hypothetical protein